jgi:DNA-binding response OmpR family regulator
MSHILVIDDEQLVANAIATMLTRAGHRVTVASNGDAGIAKFENDPADLVITDIVMPGKEGIETIRDLRRVAPQLPIIAMSGGGMRSNYDFLSMARKLGASEVLGKPFSNDELIALVTRCLERPLQADAGA